MRQYCRRLGERPRETHEDHAAYIVVRSRAISARMYGFVTASGITRSTGRPSTSSSPLLRPKYASSPGPGPSSRNSTRKSRSLRVSSNSRRVADPKRSSRRTPKRRHTSAMRTRCSVVTWYMHRILNGGCRNCKQPVWLVVPMVVSNVSLPTVAGNRRRHRTSLKHNGQRWRALAVQDYESRALPLSYGGGRPKLSVSLRNLVLRSACRLTQRKEERGALADRSLGPHATTVPGDDPLHRGEADPRAVELRLGVEALKRRKKSLRGIHIESSTVVTDEEHGLLDAFYLADFNRRDGALRRKLPPIPQQVLEHHRQ